VKIYFLFILKVEARNVFFCCYIFYRFKNIFKFISSNSFRKLVYTINRKLPKGLSSENLPLFEEYP